jgi:hypothetical protein
VLADYDLRFGTVRKGKPTMSVVSKLLAAIAALALVVLSPTSSALAQTGSPTQGSSVLPTGGGAALLDPSDTVILLLDHQTGLFQTVKDISETPRSNYRCQLLAQSEIATGLFERLCREAQPPRDDQ